MRKRIILKGREKTHRVEIVGMLIVCPAFRERRGVYRANEFHVSLLSQSKTSKK